MELSSVLGLAGVPFILALTQLVKPWVKDSRLYPLVSVVFGLGINIIVPWALQISGRVEIVSAVLMGILAGLAASGLYSAGERVAEG